MTEKQLRKEMVALGASLFNRGFSSGSGGNMSVKLPDGSILTTPTNSSMGRLDSEQLSKLSAGGELLSGAPPSKEHLFHLKIYDVRPDCGAVVHLHSTYAVGLSCCQNLNAADVLPPLTPYYMMKVAPLPLVSYYKPGSRELVEAVTDMARIAKCFLLANHGPVVTGKTLLEAVDIAEELEETAKLYFLLQGNTARMRTLTDKQVQELAIRAIDKERL